MNGNILLKTVVNEVNFREQTYIRMYNINNEKEQKGTLINLKVFLKENEFAYTPFYYEESNDKELIRRLLTADVNNDILLNVEDMNKYLNSLSKYIDITHEVVKKMAESMFENFNMLLYKEYMGVFYVVLKNKNEYLIYEVRLDKSGKLSFLYLEDNVVDFVVRRDFSKCIDENSELCLTVSKNKYIIITNIYNRQYFLEVNLSNDNYTLKSVKCNPFKIYEEENENIPIDEINKKIKSIVCNKNKYTL